MRKLAPLRTVLATAVLATSVVAGVVAGVVATAPSGATAAPPAPVVVASILSDRWCC